MRVQTLVVGGGPAGAAMATRLAADGRDVLLVEREAGPHHKVCGEFLSVETLAELRTLGIQLDALGAVPVETVALSTGRIVAEAALPFPARSLSRRRLDEALLERAAIAGARVTRGRRVVQLAREDRGWRARLADGGAVLADQAVLAVGKHDLRGWRRPPGGHDGLVGFKQHWRLNACQSAGLRGRVELFLFPGGYGGLEPVEDGAANLCLLVRRDAVGGGWADILRRSRDASRLLSSRLQDAEPLWPRPLAVASLPYGHVAPAADQLWRLGDQAAVIPSFAGDGLAIALHSARIAAEMMVAGRTAEAFQDALARQLAPQVRRATALSRLLVRPPLQPLLVSAAAAWPTLLTRVARATRIPDSALVEDGLRPRHDRAA